MRYCYDELFSSITEMGRINLNSSNETDHHGPTGITMTTGLPLGSGGSGGSAGGIWGAGMTTAMPQQPPTAPPAWEMPYMGPPSGGGSTTTYGPIYNPTAPPPSAAYGMTSYPGYGQPPSSSGSGSHRSNNRLMLAGSGSGSESASDGRTSSLMGSDKSSLLRNQQGLRQGNLIRRKKHFCSVHTVKITEIYSH